MITARSIGRTIIPRLYGEWRWEARRNSYQKKLEEMEFVRLVSGVVGHQIGFVGNVPFEFC
jgi:hypothetical protein